MNTTPSTSTQKSSDNDKSPDSGTPRTRRPHLKSSNSPTLRAFESFDESFAEFFSHVKTKIKRVGTEDVYILKVPLQRLDRECESMQKDFKNFISELDEAITNYAKKRPTDWAIAVNNVISTEEQAPYRSTLFKGKKTIDEISSDLSTSIGTIYMIVLIKIDKSIYNEYSFSLEKKLNNIKNMCEIKSKSLEKISNEIKDAIKENYQIMPGVLQIQQQQQF